MTATAQIEHVNLTTAYADRMVELLGKLFGWHKRWEGPSLNGGHSIHFGGEHDYIVLYTPKDNDHDPFPKGAPLNHVGVTVGDLDAAERVVEEAGLVPFNHGDYEPGRRFYFLDWDQTEWEVVSYA